MRINAMRYKHYLQTLHSQIASRISPKEDTRVHMIHMDSNQAYGTNGTVFSHDVGLSRYVLGTKLLHYPDPLNSLWKLCHEDSKFQVISF